MLKIATTGLEKAQQISTDELTKAMSQVTLKDVEIKQLKENNIKIQQENKTLQENVAKYNTKLMGQVQLQGAKHLLWDQIATEIAKFQDYVYFMDDKRMLASSVLTKFQITNETLQMRPLKKPQNTVNFLNQTSNETLRAL